MLNLVAPMDRRRGFIPFGGRVGSPLEVTVHRTTGWGPFATHRWLACDAVSVSTWLSKEPSKSKSGGGLVTISLEVNDRSGPSAYGYDDSRVSLPLDARVLRELAADLLLVADDLDGVPTE